MSEPFIGQIMLFAGNFAPRGWAFCNGQILSIAQNTALFSILGTTYGGNGQTTFALPDLRGRVPLSPGQGPGLPNYNLGQMSGSPTHTLITTEMPQHNHTAQVTTKSFDNSLGGTGDVETTAGHYWASSIGVGNIYSTTHNAAMAADAVGVTVGVSGGSQPHNNMQPYTAINYIIALEGIYPSRN